MYLVAVVVVVVVIVVVLLSSGLVLAVVVVVVLLSSGLVLVLVLSPSFRLDRRGKERKSKRECKRPTLAYYRCVSSTPAYLHCT